MFTSGKLRQILYDMRHQSVVTSVSLIGTALSVFLLMVVITVQQLNVMPFQPESNRSRLYYGQHIHIASIRGDIDRMGGSSGDMSYNLSERLYGGLDGVEAESKFSTFPSVVELQGTTKKFYEGRLKQTDENFWKVYDHKLLYGRFYDEAEVRSGSKVAVITESVSQRLFGKANSIGETFEMHFSPLKVVGVIADTSPLAIQSYSDVFMPLVNYNEDVFGMVEVALLLKKGADTAHIKRQVRARYAELATEMSAYGERPVYHETPYSSEVVTKGGYGSNNTPDMDGGRRMRILTYVVLLLLPAVNLSSMLHSRMRRRMVEFGIRRAFGCSRTRIIRDILGENFIVSIAGGLVGWICSIVFMRCFGGLFSNFSNPNAIIPELSLLLNWRFIGIILLVCFILNLISASIPAWQASRLNTVDAINSRQKP